MAVAAGRERTFPTPMVVQPRLARRWTLTRSRSSTRVAQQGLPWRRITFVALLALTAGLYLWGLNGAGWANSFYSAAVEAATRSWKAFLFGSFDSSNFITVDKPPASLWVMDISARIFGVNTWSILVPQALEGVATVGILYATVRRRFGHAAGLIAGLVLAVTPVAALMFRFNNPDALLVLLLVTSAYAFERALDAGKTRWIVLAGALIGLGFLTKMLQAFTVLPVLALVYMLAAPVSLRRRVAQLLAGGAAVVVSAGWWVALVELWPASSRPYIGGSTTNSVLDLIFGYNGFGRLTGDETGSVGGTGAGAWGPTGITRMFNASFGGQVSWLIPAALIGLAAVLWLRRGSPRTDVMRAAALLWGGWLVVTALLFSFAQGIIHPYYTVALAPAIGALAGMGAVMLWRERRRLIARLFLAATVAATVAWSWALLDRSPEWLPWLRLALLAAGAVAVAGLLLADRVRRIAASAVAGIALAAALGGSVAYTVDTVATPHAGAIPSAGPVVAGLLVGPAGGRGGIGPGPGGGAGARGGPPVFPFGAGALAGGGPGGFPGGGGGAGGAGGGASGGLLNASTPSAALVTVLRADASTYPWVAATVGANTAAGYQLATGDAVMAIGGFNGTDPTPSLSQFEALVADHRIHYFIAGGARGGGPGGSNSSSAIESWVAQHFTATTVSGITLYDLSAPVSDAGAG